MAATTMNPRAQAWDERLNLPVIIAAFAVLPLLALSLSKPHDTWHTVEVLGHWTVWTVFAAEVAIMLSVVDDRRAWVSDHRFEVMVVVVSSPLLPLALAAAPALRLLVLAKLFKALKLAKVIKLAKLQKAVRLVRKKLDLSPAASVALRVVSGALAALTALYITFGHTPLKGSQQAAALIAAGLLATFATTRVRARRARRAVA